MILAAGLGTRLRPLTDATPKPLCPVGDRPQIEHVFALLARSGVPRAVVNTHHLHEQFTPTWASRQPLSLTLIHEPEILGTGGGVANAARALGEGPVLVWNGDILAGPRLERLFASPLGLATLVVGPRRPIGEGTLGLAADGSVARIRAARRGEEIASADYAGIALLSETFRARLAAPSCLVGDGFVPSVARGERLDTFALDSAFEDTGSLGAYLDANLGWLETLTPSSETLTPSSRALTPSPSPVNGRGEENENPLPHTRIRERGPGGEGSQGPGREGSRTSFIHPTARVDEGAVVERSVVGAGARVSGRGRVFECVIWPSAEAHAPLERVIVTPLGVVTP